MKKLRLIFAVLSIILGMSIFQEASAQLVQGIIAETGLSQKTSEALLENDSECMFCKTTDRFIVLMGNLSYQIFKELSSLTIALIGIFMGLWIVWTFLQAFIGLGIPTFDTIYKNFAPKLFMSVFVVAILALPTPKIIYQLMLEPVLSVGVGYGTRLMRATGGEDSMAKYYDCLVTKKEYEEERMESEGFSPYLRKSLTCMVEQSKRMSSVGTVVGQLLLMQSWKAKYAWVPFLIPNMLMGFVGLILLIAYWALHLTFLLLLYGSLFELAVIILFLPFTLMGVVFTSGEKPIPFFGGMLDTTKKTLINATFTITFLCLFLSLIHAFMQAVMGFDGSVFAYDQIVEWVKNGEADKVVETVFVGSSEMLLMLLMAFLGVFLMAEAKTLANKFSDGIGGEIKLNEKLLDFVNKQSQNGLKKLKGGWDAGKKAYQKTNFAKRRKFKPKSRGTKP